MATTCERCGVELEIGTWPWCPHGKPSFGVIPDGIPGGALIKHGLCHEDGTPRKFYSRSEIRKAAFEKGLTWANETPKPNQRLVEADHARRERNAKNN